MKKKEEARQRMEHLIGEIRRHQDLYYKKAQPEIEDSEYDALFDQLLELEKDFPELASVDSPTRRVGSDLDNDFPEVEHPEPMLSLDKVYDFDDLAGWVDKTERDAQHNLSFVVEEKIDGSTIVLHYEQGILRRAVTRGDGFVGNDITDNVRTIRDIPLRLERDASSVFRGEIYIEKDIFDELNRKMGEVYANPRNFAAGNLRRKHSAEVAQIPLRAYVYEGLAEEAAEEEHITVLHRLAELGFRVSESIGFFSHDDAAPANEDIFVGHSWVRGPLEDLPAYIREKSEGRSSLPYEIDGYVVKVNDYPERRRMGSTSHHPRWAIAYKFEAPQAVSVVREIELQVGRTGRVTPVARIDPVWISGSTVSNVTLHNQAYILGLGVARGDRVAVSKRGDVIPAVEDVLEKNSEGNRTFQYPERCPVCETRLVQDGAHHFCPNQKCPARVLGRVAFFAARGQMDIENLGAETVKTLLDTGLIEDIPDIYEFDPEELLGREGFGEKKVSLIAEGIEGSKRRPFAVVLASLGLEEIGPKVVELLIDGGYDSIDRLIRAAKEGNPDVFTDIPGIGPKTAKRIIEQLNDEFVLDIIERLRQSGLKFEAEGKAEKKDMPQPFEGQVWCVTGSFEHFRPRDAAMEEVKRRGGRVTSVVTGKTTHLLAGENPGSKLAKAREVGARIVHEDEFMDMIDQREDDA
jgi:DNA ligase (NAD+)